MTADVEIHARAMRVDERLEKYITKKASNLDRYINGVQDVRIDLTHAKTARNANDRHVAQITLHGNKFILRSEERADDIFVAFDSAIDKIQRRIERYKGKHYRKRGDGASMKDAAMKAMEEELYAEEEGYEIVRRKKFILIPMDELEAIEQMKLLGHEDFFVFYNANTSQVNMLYRRRDDTYGLIETVLG